MNIQKLKEKTDQVIDQYTKELDSYSYEQLIQKPSETSWSVGQVYIHLWMASKGFFFKNAEKCLTATDTVSGKGKNWAGYLVFILGKMPQTKVKMPAKVAVEPRQPESKDQLIAKLNEIRSLAQDYIAKIPNADPKLKTRHPFLGYLNCAEWVSLCNMHFHHHEAQIKRINKARLTNN
jgi:hypothetical protein